MPIDLNNLVQASMQNKKIYSPKFFSSILTGNGKRRGLLNENNNPSILRKNADIAVALTTKNRILNGTTEVHHVPLNTLPYAAWNEMALIPTPEKTETTEIATYTSTGNTSTKCNTLVLIQMKIHSLVYQAKEDVKLGMVVKTLVPCYQLRLFEINDLTCPTCTRMQNNTAFNSNLVPLPANRYWDMYTGDVTTTMQEITDKLIGYGFTVDINACNTFIADFSLYESVALRANEWTTTIDKTLDVFFENAHARGLRNEDIIPVLKYIEQYNIPLELYRNIYKSIKTHLPDKASEVCKHNLNLLLSETLNNLDNKKPVLNSLSTPSPAVTLPNTITKWSREQKNAMCSADPLILVQAGAGTGKSTVILGRIDYMLACGVDPEDIMVLSFTNAAADNITNKNASVHSMTIARMIHTIYSENFPKHELSSEKTLENCLDIYFPTDGLADTFKRKLKAMDNNEPNAFTEVNSFVEENYDDVIRMLDTIGQTTLNLEIIICYQRIDELTEPSAVQSKYLIIDEVQDNSIFEFIYTLKYVDKHEESLFIVGDCSQTLYEFRASNPKALNVLEGSGVFSTYQLQTNYRSNQEILDFANKALLNIEANQYANIQLQANSLRKVTEQSFKKKVHFKYHTLSKQTDFTDEINDTFARDCKTYIDACLQKKEQVAILAYKRLDIYRVMDVLKKMYPKASFKNLIPERMFDSTIFSTFIKMYWNEVKFMPSKAIDVVIAQAVLLRSDYLMRGDREKNNLTIQRILSDWRSDNSALIQSWQTQYENNLMPADEFYENLKQNMLNYEISQNAVRQSVLSAKNAANKAQTDIESEFIVSTIHSAKGLEFDNTIVIHHNKNDMEEDEKRMYYVAFTRAKHSEFILSYDLVRSPQIETDYMMLVKTLHDRDMQFAKAANMYTTVHGTAGSVTETIDPCFYNDDGDYAIDVSQLVITKDDEEE